jgi:hypothetical protein
MQVKQTSNLRALGLRVPVGLYSVGLMSMIQSHFVYEINVNLKVQSGLSKFNLFMFRTASDNAKIYARFELTVFPTSLE